MGEHFFKVRTASPTACSGDGLDFPGMDQASQGLAEVFLGLDQASKGLDQASQGRAQASQSLA